MFKNKWPKKVNAGNVFAVHKSSDRQYNTSINNGHTKVNQDFLSNIVEEGSSEDLPRTLEQEEQYLNDCLRSMGGSVEDVHGSEVEEYDFDDFNSIASTASILNLNTDLSTEDRLRMTSPPLSKRTTQNGVKPDPTWTEVEQSMNGLRALSGNESLTNFQKSISRVQNWDRLGRGGEKGDWNQVLLRAAEAGDLITVQDAVSHLGATRDSLVLAKDVAGNTPLHKAAQNGKLQCLKWLVKRAPLDAVTMSNYDDMTPAAMATQFGQIECLEWLVEQTVAKKEVEKRNAFTLVHYAAKEGQEDCLKYLLSHLSKTVNISGITDSNGVAPAHLAAREGHLECLQTLVDYGSDVTLKDKEGCTAADYGFKSGQTGCGRYLVVVETCLGLSVRVKNLSQSLAKSRSENEELRSRLQVLESYTHTYMSDRPEAVGGDQSDSSSTISMDGIKTNQKIPQTRRSRRAPDGESPKGTKNVGTVHDFQVNGHPNHNTLNGALSTQAYPREKWMRRRGSYPFAHHGQINSKDESQGVYSNQKSPGSRHPVTSQLKDDHQAIVKRSSCASVTMSTRPVVQHGNSSRQGISQDSNYRNCRSPDRSNSMTSSRSQSPSSTETVLGSTPKEYYLRIQKCKGNDSSDRANSFALKSFTKNNNFHSEQADHRASYSSESPFSSDSDVEHTYERRKSSDSQVTSSQNELKVIRVTKHREVMTSTSSLANERKRQSWHGVDIVGKIPSPQRYDAHNVVGSNCRPLERRAQVTWGEQKGQRSYTSNHKMFEHLKSVPRVNNFGSKLESSKKSEEKPWYETEEVEL